MGKFPSDRKKSMYGQSFFTRKHKKSKQKFLCKKLYSHYCENFIVRNTKSSQPFHYPKIWKVIEDLKMINGKSMYKKINDTFKYLKVFNIDIFINFGFSGFILALMCS